MKDADDDDDDEAVENLWMMMKGEREPILRRLSQVTKLYTTVIAYRRKKEIREVTKNKTFSFFLSYFGLSFVVPKIHSFA